MSSSDPLRELYQEVILDHHRRPRNFRVIDPATATAEGHNPLCGDRYTIYVRLEGERIEDVSFQGAGCAISKASASIMTDALKGRTRAEARDIFDAFQAMVTGESTAEPPEGPGLDKLEVFSGVRAYPSRVKCATLAWHALQAALRHATGTVTTE